MGVPVSRPESSGAAETQGASDRNAHVKSDVSCFVIIDVFNVVNVLCKGSSYFWFGHVVTGSGAWAYPDACPYD